MRTQNQLGLTVCRCVCMLGTMAFLSTCPQADLCATYGSDVAFAEGGDVDLGDPLQMGGFAAAASAGGAFTAAGAGGGALLNWSKHC